MACRAPLPPRLALPCFTVAKYTDAFCPEDPSFETVIRPRWRQDTFVATKLTIPLLRNTIKLPVNGVTVSTGSSELPYFSPQPESQWRRSITPSNPHITLS